MKSKKPRIKYLNTDLDLESHDDLRPLARALERAGLFLLHADKGQWRPNRWGACLEIQELRYTPNGTIVEMLNAIEALKPAARTQWDRCVKREANIGYDSGRHPPTGQFNHKISVSTMRRMVDARLSMRITIYPIYQEDEQA